MRTLRSKGLGAQVGEAPQEEAEAPKPTRPRAHSHSHPPPNSGPCCPSSLWLQEPLLGSALSVNPRVPAPGLPVPTRERMCPLLNLLLQILGAQKFQTTGRGWGAQEALASQQTTHAPNSKVLPVLSHPFSEA